MTDSPDKNRPLAIDLGYEEWVSLFERMGQPSYRAGQVTNWLWCRGVSDPAGMTNLGKPLREELVRNVDFTVPVVDKEERARDGTRKFLVSMRDSVRVETALLKQGDRLTACISTQAGCPVGCPFCVTGGAEFERNLSRGEIAYQMILMERRIGREINNVVLMGMGEPFLNTDESLAAIRMLNDPKLRGLGIRHMTVSTSGIIPGIRALADAGLGVRLAVSLHAVDDDLRDELVPSNTTYPVADLLAAIRDYQERTGDRVTIEYALFKGKNDSLEQARKLVRALRGIHVYINLIPANSGRAGYERSRDEDVLRFQSVLKSAGFESEIRVERGAEINAACGQLKGAEDVAGRPERKAEKSPVGTKRPGGEKRKPPQRPRKGDAAAKRDDALSGGRGDAVRPKGRGRPEREGGDARVSPERPGGKGVGRRQERPRRGGGGPGKPHGRD